MSDHEHAYLICENKCLVEGATKEKVDGITAKFSDIHKDKNNSYAIDLIEGGSIALYNEWGVPISIKIADVTANRGRYLYITKSGTFNIKVVGGVTNEILTLSADDMVWIMRLEIINV